MHAINMGKTLVQMCEVLDNHFLKLIVWCFASRIFSYETQNFLTPFISHMLFNVLGKERLSFINSFLGIFNLVMRFCYWNIIIKIFLVITCSWFICTNHVKFFKFMSRTFLGIIANKSLLFPNAFLLFARNLFCRSNFLFVEWKLYLRNKPTKRFWTGFVSLGKIGLTLIGSSDFDKADSNLEYVWPTRRTIFLKKGFCWESA